MTRRGERCLCAPPFTACVLVTDKVLAILVDGVVREVHAHVILERK